MDSKDPPLHRVDALHTQLIRWFGTATSSQWNPSFDRGKQSQKLYAMP